jgi:hypothetical protein
MNIPGVFAGVRTEPRAKSPTAGELGVQSLDQEVLGGQAELADLFPCWPRVAAQIDALTNKASKRVTYRSFRLLRRAGSP